MSPNDKMAEPPALPADDRPCLFCHRKDDDRFLYGPKYSSTWEGKDIVAHHLCLLFSCGLTRTSDNDKDGIQGFAEAAIMKEVRRGSKLKCVYCKKSGATLGCCFGPKCKKAYHMPCGLENQIHFVVSEIYESFCRTHHKLTPIIINNETEDVEICASCTEPIDLLSDPLLPDVIQCKCCKHVCHKQCVQKFAFISGKVHFKCSFCNCNDLKDAGLNEQQAYKGRKCKRRYVTAANQIGVFVPEKDADWELDHSFESHVAEYGKCDIEDEEGNSNCICDRGIEYDERDHKRNKWYIVLCSLCAAHGCHRACRNIAGKDCDDWKCDFCSDVLNRSKENRRTGPVPNAIPAAGPSSALPSDEPVVRKRIKVHRAERSRLNPMARLSTDAQPVLFLILNPLHRRS